MNTGEILADGIQYGHMAGFGWWGWGMMVFWIVLIGAIVYALVRPTHPLRQEGRPSGRDPLVTLADRYARGEIDSDEYRTRREVLEG